MAVNVLHLSDLHGSISRFIDSDLVAAVNKADMFLFTGDMFPNYGRPIIAEHESIYQLEWWGKMAKMVAIIKNTVAKRPILVVNGNHDFVDLATLLTESGFENVSSVSSEALLNVCGLTFAGFPHIPFIKGEWNHETQYPELAVVVDKVLELRPDVLVTHAPPNKILDDDGYGINPLSMAIMYGNTNPVSFKHHFFGHCHTSGGQTEEVEGIKFYNGATEIMLHNISV